MHFRPLGPTDAQRIARLQRRLFAPAFRESAEEIREMLCNAEEHLVCNLSFGLFDDRKMVGYLFAWVETESAVHDRDEEVVYLKEIGLLPGYESHLRATFSRLYRQWVAFTPGLPLEAHVVPAALDNWRRLERLLQFYGLRLTDSVDRVSEEQSPYRLIRLDVDAATVGMADLPRPIRARPWQHESGVSVSVVTDPREWLSLKPLWPELLAATPDSNVFQSFDYLWQWWTCCGIWNDLRIFVIRRGDEVIGVVPMMLRYFPVYGKTMRNLAFLTARMDMNRPKLIFGREESACTEAFFAWLDAHRDEWDILDIDEQPAGAALTRLRRTSSENGHLLGEDETLCPRIRLQGSWEDFLATRSSRMRSNIRRLRRRLDDHGDVEVDCVTEASALEDALDTYCEIEAESWKPEAGVDLLSDRGRYFFNLALTRVFGATGEFEIRTLRCDGKPIASTYGICRDGVFQSLRIAHVESYSPFSPGTLLESLEIESLFGRGLNSYEFLGSFLTNKLRWTDDVVRTVNLHVFRRRPRLVLFHFVYFVLRVRVKNVLKSTGHFDRVLGLMRRFRLDLFPRYD